MKSLKKMLWFLAVVVIMLGISNESSAVQVQAAPRQLDLGMSKIRATKSSVTDIKVTYRKKARVRNARKCTDYFLWEHLQLEAYGVNAKGKKVKKPVIVQEHGKFLYAKNGRIKITLKCGDVTKRIYLTNIIPVEKVVVKCNGVKLIKNKRLTKTMVKKLIFQTTWKNGRFVERYRGAQCLDVGKKITTRGKSVS